MHSGHTKRVLSVEGMGRVLGGDGLQLGEYKDLMAVVEVVWWGNTGVTAWPHCRKCRVGMDPVQVGGVDHHCVDRRL